MATRLSQDRSWRSGLLQRLCSSPCSRVFGEPITPVQPMQPFAPMHMKIRLKILGIFQARCIQMNLVRKLVVFEGDRGSAIAAKHAARARRRSIDFRHLSGKGKGLVGNAEPCSERGRGVAAAAFAVAMRAPDLCPGELERYGTAKTPSPLRHHQTSIYAPENRHEIKRRISPARPELV